MFSVSVNASGIKSGFAAVASARLPLTHHLPLLPYPGSTGGAMAARGTETTL